MLLLTAECFVEPEVYSLHGVGLTISLTWLREEVETFKWDAKIKFFFTLGLFSSIFFPLLFLYFVKCRGRDIRTFLWKSYSEEDTALSHGTFLGFWQCPRWVWVHMANIPVVILQGSQDF